MAELALNCRKHDSKQIFIKLDGIAPLVADRPKSNSTYLQPTPQLLNQSWNFKIGLDLR